MASALALAHIEGERRLRQAVRRAVERLWRGLPGYDEEHVDQWLLQVIPTVLAGQRQSVALTDAYLARVLRRAPIGIRPDELIGPAIRNGTPSEEQWRRPFVTVWTALGKETPFADAVGAGLSRAGEMAAWDVQGSMRATANAVQEADDGIVGYERVADGDACDFCAEVDGAFVKSADAMSLHNGCGCGLEPVTADTRGARKSERSNPNVAIHDHGEMGPTIGAPEHNFTTESAALG